MAAFDSYILCTTPRSGSTLLCDLLSATGRTGVPDSFFMRDLDPVWAERWGLPSRNGRGARDHARAYLRAAIRAGLGETGVFGLRLMERDRGGLLELIKAAHPGQVRDRDRLATAFGRVLHVHLTRADKLAQAVSLVKAQQTGLWHIGPDGREVERLSPPRPPVYDHGRLATARAEFERGDRDWRDWFAAQGTAPLSVRYESLSADPAAELARVCAGLGVAAPAAGQVQPGVAPLADDLSRAWMARFRQQEAGDGS